MVNNNSTVLLIGKIIKPMTVKEVDIDGNKKTVGSMTVVVPKFAKNPETGKYERQEGTFYEVTSWSPRQQEFLTTLRKDEAILLPHNYLPRFLSDC